jgi:hypothetical protein
VIDHSSIPTIEIAPEPSPEEMAAIVAAVTAAVMTRPVESGQQVRPPELSRWARAGRLAAMATLEPSSLP